MILDTVLYTADEEIRKRASRKYSGCVHQISKSQQSSIRQFLEADLELGRLRKMDAPSTMLAKVSKLESHS